MLNQDVIREGLVNLIVQYSLSLRLVKEPDFYTFCQLLNPKVKGVITIVYSIVRNLIKNLYDLKKDLVRKDL